MLEHLNVIQLQAELDLASDGWLDLAMQIKGSNPIKQQSVNFNYTHKENVFTLMKALRLNSVIRDKVEQQMKTNN